MYCRKCGKEVNDDALFCPYCGTKKLQEKENDDADIVQVETKNVEKASSGRDKKRKVTVVAVLLIIVIAICSVVSLCNPNRGYYVVKLNVDNYEDYLNVVTIKEIGNEKHDLHITSKIEGAIFENVKIKTTDRSPIVDYVYELPQNGNFQIRFLVDERTPLEKAIDFDLKVKRLDFKMIEGIVKIPKKGIK